MGPVRVLLDTHALIWWLFDDPKLPLAARRAIADPGNEVLVSCVSAWEIATKHRLGKLAEAGDLPDRFEHYLTAARFASCPSGSRTLWRPGGCLGRTRIRSTAC